MATHKVCGTLCYTEVEQDKWIHQYYSKYAQRLFSLGMAGQCFFYLCLLLAAQ